MKPIMSGNSLTQWDNHSRVKAEKRMLNWALHVVYLFALGLLYVPSGHLFIQVLYVLKNQVQVAIYTTG